MPALIPDILTERVPHEGAIYCLGAFDGVHRGHLHLMDLVGQLRAATGLPAWALVLYRDPSNPLFAHTPLLTTREERDLVLAQTPLDGVATLTLSTDVTGMAHNDFVRDILLDRLKARHLVVGWDFHYGHARVGNVSLLRQQLEALPAPGCALTMVDPVMDGPEPIKSTTIRRFLQEGDLNSANAWLTRPFFVLGTVVEGQRLGRTLGFPTANLAAPPFKLRPARGVYCCIAECAGARYYAAVNVGVRPTIGSGYEPTIEAHLLDFEGDLYGKTLILHFLTRLRAEQEFASLGDLKDQLALDVADVQSYAARHPLSELEPLLP